MGQSDHFMILKKYEYENLTVSRAKFLVLCNNCTWYVNT